MTSRLRCLLVLLFGLTAADALASEVDCARLKNGSVPFSYVKRTLVERDGKIADQYSVGGNVGRRSDGTAEVGEWSPGFIGHQQPSASAISIRDGIEIRRVDVKRGRKILNWRQQNTTVAPAGNGYGSGKDFDVTLTTKFEHFWLKSKTSRIHVTFVASRIITIGSCPYKTLRYDLASEQIDIPQEYRKASAGHLIFAPELGIVLSQEWTSDDTRSSFEVTDISTDLAVPDIGFPFNVPVVVFPLPPIGAIAMALNRNSTADDCTRLRETDAPFTLTTYEREEREGRKVDEDFPILRVHRFGKGLVEETRALGKKAGTMRFRYGLYVGGERNDPRVSTKIDRPSISADLLTLRTDSHFTSALDVTTDRERRTYVSDTSVRYVGQRIVRVGICFFRVFDYSMGTSVVDGSRTAKSSSSMSFSPDLGIILESTGSSGPGSKTEKRAISISLDMRPLPGIADPTKPMTK